MPPGMLQRQKSGINNNKIFVVCLDGSRLSMRGLRLAAFTMQPTDKVQLVTVDVEAELVQGKTPEQILSDASLYLTTTGRLRDRQVSKSVLKVGEGQTIQQVIINAGNWTSGGAGVLVLGSAGRGGEAAEESAGRRPKGQQPMGHVAEAVMAVSKVPGAARVPAAAPRRRPAARMPTPRCHHPRDPSRPPPPPGCHPTPPPARPAPPCRPQSCW